jgi:hypothetical protein
MLKARISSFLCVFTLFCAGCETTVGDPDPQYLGPAVIDLSPGPGQTDFYFEDNLHVVFEFAPDAAQLNLLDATETPVSAAASISADGTTYRLDPASSLTPDSDYTLEIQVTEPDSPPLRISFRTSLHGLPVDTTTGGLWGAVYRLDTAGAIVTEPAKAGTVLLNQLEDWNILLGIGESSSFDSESQPGVHIQAALGRPKGDGYEQDPCGRTVSLTWGADGIIGTEDDVPATFEDPRIDLSPGDVDVLVGLVPTHIGGLNFSALFHPELTDMQGAVVAGTIDTRALDMLFFEKGGQEGITCSLLESLDIPCEECGAENPGAFCLPIRAENVQANRVAMPPVEQHTCADVIEHFDSTGECSEQILIFEPQADNSYLLCPEYSN